MTPEQQAQLDEATNRLKAVEDFVTTHKSQQISFPLDENSKRILEELIKANAPTATDATKLLLTGDMVYTTLGGMTGRLACNGDPVSRTTYANLFAVIGTTYGSGDGSTTFNVPNAIGRVLVMVGNATFTAMGQIGGEETHQLITSEIPSHDHSMGSFFSASGASNGVSGGGLAPNVFTRTQSTGGDGAHNNLQPYLVVRLYIII